jgi:hypothetical protein
MYKIFYIISRIIILIFSLYSIMFIFKRMNSIQYHLQNTYENIYDIKEQLNSGDVICFFGDCYDSKWVDFFNNTITSHCGIIIRDPDSNDLYIYNSTPDIRNIDICKNKHIEGSQLNCFENLISIYQGHCVVRKLEPPIQNDKNKMNLLKKIIKDTHHIPFTADPWRSYISTKTNFIKPPNIYKETWCIWLVIYIYQYIGILDPKILSHRITTNYLLNDNKNINFLNGYNFSKLYYIRI